MHHVVSNCTVKLYSTELYSFPAAVSLLFDVAFKATSKNLTLVHGLWMGGRSHLVQRGGDRPSPPRPLLAVPNVTVHPSTASIATSNYSMWHYNWLCTLNSKGLNHESYNVKEAEAWQQI